MKQALPLCALLAALFESALAEHPIRASDAWVRAAPPGTPSMAGYLVLENRGSEEAVMVDVDSPRFARAQLHRTVVEEGLTRMVHQPEIRIPAGGRLAFEPGGYHIMLMHPRGSVAPGEAVSLQLRFRDLPDLALEAPVRRQR